MGSIGTIYNNRMKTQGKYIGINQRIPFDVLDAAIHHYIQSGTISKASVLSHMLEFTKGMNRAEKAATYIVQIVTRQQKLIDEFKKLVNDTSYLMLNSFDRKVFALCLLSLTYPITYDLLITLASGFKVQDQINRQFINKKMGLIYGSNRTLDIALDALIPMIIELNTISRVKTSLYSLSGKISLNHPFLVETLIYTDIKLSDSKSILFEELKYRPWYIYFNIEMAKDQHFRLLKLSESFVGGGYLTLNS